MQSYHFGMPGTNRIQIETGKESMGRDRGSGPGVENASVNAYSYKVDENGPVP